MTTQNTGREFLQLKVFLYKCTPPFTLTDSAGSNIFNIDKYAVNLDPQYFSKYDISNLVTGYTFNQSLSENTYSWTIQAIDPIISFSDINTKLKVLGPDLSAQSLTNLAQYEAEAQELTDTNIIQVAKINRGVGQDALTVRNLSNLADITGLRLSDLIQPYDIISLFLYKSYTPIDQITGQIVVSNGGTSANSFPSFVQGLPQAAPLTASNLQSEYVLLSPDPNQGGQSLFSNEFNGFVTTKTFQRSVGSVDTITVAGNGLSRLFGSTRKVLKGSALGQTIYDVAETTDPTQAVAFDNVYAGKKLSTIFQDLFNFVYQITFTQPIAATTFNAAGRNFFDISALLTRNLLQVNQFTLPVYLMSQMMLLRGFSYRTPIPSDETDLLANAAATTQTSSGQLDQSNLISFLNQNSDQQIQSFLNDPVFFSSELDSLEPYFFVMNDVLTDFNAELKTPFEIIDELKSKTFLEFYEMPTGFMVIRQPEYNDRTTTIFSSLLNIIDVSYRETVDHLVSRVQVGYTTITKDVVNPLQAFIYSNGKLLIQFGFMETDVDPNPIVSNQQFPDNSSNPVKNPGFFAYAQFFLRIHDAGLKTASITANLNPRIIVGRTYFDQSNQKFGYITSVSKNVNVSGTATMNFGLSYVRDAFLQDADILDATTIETETLPTILNIAEAFSNPPITITVAPNPEPTSVLGS